MLSLPFRAFVFKVFIGFIFLWLLGLSTSNELFAENNLTLISASTIQNESPADTQSENMPPKNPVMPLEPFPFPLEEEKAAAKEDSHFWGQFIKMLFTLGALVAVLLLASWSLKRMLHSRVQQLNVSSAIKVLESRGLSNKSAIYLIEVKNKTILLGETMHSLALLGEWEEDLESESTE